MGLQVVAVVQEVVVVVQEVVVAAQEVVQPQGPLPVKVLQAQLAPWDCQAQQDHQDHQDHQGHQGHQDPLQPTLPHKDSSGIHISSGT